MADVLEKNRCGIDFSQIKPADLPLLHDFAPGLYMRQILMPAGVFVIGKIHKTEHFNIVLTGSATVLMEGKLHEIKAPQIFTSKPGVRKVLLIHEEMIWATAHPSEETDIAKLEEMLAVQEETNLDPLLVEFKEKLEERSR